MGGWVRSRKLRALLLSNDIIGSFTSSSKVISGDRANATVNHRSRFSARVSSFKVSNSLDVFTKAMYPRRTLEYGRFCLLATLALGNKWRIVSRTIIQGSVTNLLASSVPRTYLTTYGLLISALVH